MAENKEARDLTYGDDTRLKLLNGVKAVYKAVTSTYGPMATNVLLQKSWGQPVLTRDGVTVAKDVVLEDNVENMAAQLVIQASETTNRLAGDGTTATVALTYHIVSEAMKSIAFGENPMLLRKAIMDSAKTVIDFIEGCKTEITPEKLKEVATVSCGDPAVGALIAEALVETGLRGGVMVQEHELNGLKLEFMEGYHFNAGTYSLDQLRLVYEPTLIVITERRLAANSDITPILQYVAEQAKTKRVVIVGEVVDAAAQTFLLNQQKGIYDGCCLNPGLTGYARDGFFEDLAKYCGGKVIKAGDPLLKDSIGEYFGEAGKVIITDNSTTVFDGGGNKEDIDLHVEKLESIKKEETNEYKTEQLEARISRLTGKIAVIKVGAATQVEREELKYRVDDAVQATRAAREDGIVPGGGTVLLQASQLEVVDRLVANALKQPFIKLMKNAGEPADHRLMQVLGSKPGYGFDLRNMSKEPVDLIKAGVIDPAKVMKQVVQNACSVAGNIITTNCAITYAKRDIDGEQAGTKAQ